MQRNSRTVKVPYGEISVQQNFLRLKFLTAKFPYGEISLRRNCLTVKVPHDEISYSEISHGEAIV